MKSLILGLLVLSLSSAAQQQGVHPSSTQYEWPTDPQVKQKLGQWQDQKFGMIIHWGLYAVPGIINSCFLPPSDVTYQQYNLYFQFRPSLLFYKLLTPAF